jgi:hypothetical protein
MNEDHRWFLVEYTLRRALANRGGLEGKTTVREAEEAWIEINKLAPVEKGTEECLQ